MVNNERVLGMGNGFKVVAVELQGLCSGSMNETLAEQEKSRHR